jgi:hypothetical protein
MVKKKQTSELRSSTISLQVSRCKDLPTIRAGAKTYWNADHVQPFFPPIETLFKTENLENVHEYGLKFDEQVQSILSKNTIQTSAGQKNVHIKSTMLLSPFKWMRGDYSTTLGLGTTQETAATIHHKVQSHHNAAYVGSLFSSVFSQTKCVHFPKVYGVFSGISSHHTIDISDDYEDLMDKPWFSQNIGQTFELKLNDSITTPAFQHTRVAKQEMNLSDDTSILNGIEEIPGIASEDVIMGELNPVFASSGDDIDAASESSSVSTSYIFDIRSCDCSVKEDTKEEEDGDGFAWATFKNVPVQYTLMEQCEGVLHTLMTEQTDTQKHLAWITQVIFALLYIQKTFGFVHNDLHSNNIMYVSTNKEFLYYKVGEKTYKVPTYGYIIKLIDFERGMGSIRLAGMKEPKHFMSDHFAMNEEAGGQYNTDPFYIQKFPVVKANPSFDLARLATSLFWDLFPKGPEENDYASNPVFQVLMRWLKVDNTSLLFAEGNPRHERYHGFHLYKAIARFCKDTALPRKEVETIPYESTDVLLQDCLVIPL